MNNIDKEVKKEITISSKLLGKRYYDTATLYLGYVNSSNNDGNLFPEIYLKRHILELLFKSYIFSSIKKQNIQFDGSNSLNVEIDKKTYSTKTHSLSRLFELIETVDTKLVKDFNDDQNLKTEISRWSVFDNDNELFRYPISKKGKMTKLIVYSTGEELDISPEINSKSSSKFFGITENSVNGVNLNMKSLEYKKFLEETIERFLEILGK